MKMNMLTLTVIALCTQVLIASPGKGQRVRNVMITLELKNETLKNAFTKIEKLSDFRFAYKLKQVSKYKGIDLEKETRSLETTLNLVLNGTNLGFKQVNNSIIIFEKEDNKTSVFIPEEQLSDFIVQTDGSIRGKVTNENGDPVSGATVTLVGANKTVAANNKGEFVIENVKPGIYKLQITAVGFDRLIQDVKVSDGIDAVVNVRLKENVNTLGEVVVTALGITREKKALGYSAQVVKGEELTEARETNVVNSLKGKIAGLHVNPTTGGPGGSSFVMIRGNSSLTGNGQPLYVVDGLPIDNQTLDATRLYDRRDYGDGINNINPDDIESITVLKGPAAASLYGARGANGVILLTTKKGKKRKGIGVDFNSNATFETPNDIPKFQTTWGGGFEDGYAYLSPVGDAYRWPSWLNTEWGGKYDGRKLIFQAFPELGPVPYTAQPSDNIKKFYQTGSTITNTIGLSGGDEKTSYRFSLSDLRNDGIVPTNKLDRQTINLRISSKVTERLSVDAKINYIRQHGINRPENNLSFASPASNLNVMPRVVNLEWLKNYKRDNGTQIHFKNGNPYNPYWIINELLNNDSRERLIGFISAKYKFSDWLSLQARTGTDFYTDVRFSRIGTNTPFQTQGGVENNVFNVKEENSDVLLTASGKLSKSFNGSFSAGANHLNRRQELVGVRGDGLNMPGLYQISNARRVVPRNELIRKQMNSGYFMGQLEYKNFLFLDITGRNDWSSTLGSSNRSFFYPSVSSSFVFTDAFALNPKILSFGKLRASYAEAGNDASPYQTKEGYDVNSSTTFNGQPFANIKTDIPLLNLKNELTRTYEFGTELRFFNNRLGLDFTYYNSSTTNQIFPVEISAATGFSTRLINAGEIKNTGIELLLNGTPVKTSNFKWDITLNLSKNKSKVLSLAPGISAITLLDPDGVGRIEARVGEAYGNIVGFPYLRNANGDILLDQNGVWQKGTQTVILGNIQPDFLAGLTNSFSFKGFELSALVDVRKGGQVVSWTKYDQYRRGTSKLTEDRGTNMIANGVIESSPGNFVKSNKLLIAQNFYAQRGWGNIGEEFVLKADYVALREVTLGYNLGRLFQKNTFLNAAKFSIVGRNLGYLYRDPQFKTMGISPERAFNSSTAAQGFEARGIPTTRSLGFNLSFSF